MKIKISFVVCALILVVLGCSQFSTRPPQIPRMDIVVETVTEHQSEHAIEGRDTTSYWIGQYMRGIRGLLTMKPSREAELSARILEVSG